MSDITEIEFELVNRIKAAVKRIAPNGPPIGMMSVAQARKYLSELLGVEIQNGPKIETYRKIAELAEEKANITFCNVVQD